MSSYRWKVLGAGAMLAAFLSVSVSMSADAMTRQDIVVGQYTPNINLSVSEMQEGDDLWLKVKNPTAQDVVFYMPQMDADVYVPAGEQRDVTLNIRPVHDQQIMYYIHEPDGELLSSGVVNNQGSGELSLENVIASNSNIRISETAYFQKYFAPLETAEAEQPEQRQAVRGYW